MTIDQLLKEVKSHARIDEDKIAVDVLLAHVLGKSKEELFINGEDVVGNDQVKKFMELYERYKDGEPVAHLTNSKEFFGLDFFVDKNVLIPRPETEMLVEKVIDEVKSDQKEVKILDVGTGSGNIAISLAHSISSAKIVAVDVSSEALEIATKNAEQHGVMDQIELMVSDLLEEVEGEFDYIVANLPYIGEERHNYVSKEAKKFEPHVALFGGSNGLMLYEKLFQQISEKRLKPRMLLGEFGFLQGEEMRDLLSKYFEQEEWEIVSDYASIERMFVVNFNK